MIELEDIDRIHKLFPVEVMQFKCPDHIVGQALELLYDEELGMHNLGTTVYTSRGDLHTRPEWTEVSNFIQECLNRWMVHYQLYCNELTLSLMWGVFSKAKSGGGHPIHRHPMSAVSGVLYLTDGVSTIFHDPVTSRNTDTLEVLRNDGWFPEETIAAKRGKLILFPGWLFHSSEGNDGEDRWAVSFNSMPTGDVNNTAQDYPMARIQVS